MLEKRNKRIYKLYREGYGVPSICEEFNLSRSRVYQILRILSIENKNNDSEELLTSLGGDRKVYHCIRRHGIHDLKTLKDIIDNHLHLLVKMDGIGLKGFETLLKKLGYKKDIYHMCKIYKEYNIPCNSEVYADSIEHIKKRPTTIRMYYRKRDIISALLVNPKSIRYLEPKFIDSDICNMIKDMSTIGYRTIEHVHKKLKTIKLK